MIGESVFLLFTKPDNFFVEAYATREKAECEGKKFDEVNQEWYVLESFIK